jgi:hypothetical protein
LAKGMTNRERDIVDRLHHLADGPIEPAARSVVAEGLGLILELIEARGKRRDFDEQWDRPHDEG